jgi:hypothetical protein
VILALGRSLLRGFFVFLVLLKRNTRNKGGILFVATKPQARELIREEAIRASWHLCKAFDNGQSYPSRLTTVGQ